jgi:ADP-ribose pyrophosphatase YjhB (NUDIX family)
MPWAGGVLRVVTDGIRFVALGAVRRDDELLVWEGESPSGEPFYRLLGGGVEFDEHSREAVVREFDEELGVELLDPTAVGTFERVFERDGEPAHEVWRVYEGRIAEDWPYADESFAFVEPERGTEHVARWLSIERLRHPDVAFYVPEILDALTA